MREDDVMLPYEELLQSRDNWKKVCYSLMDQLRMIASGASSDNFLVAELAKLSEWNARHIDTIDTLTQALKGGSNGKQ